MSEPTIPANTPTRVVLHKQEPTLRSDVIPDVVIEVRLQQPQVDDVQSATRVFEQDADALARALWDSLPGGTIDRLLMRLLEERVSLFRVGFLSTQELIDIAEIRRHRGEVTL